MYNVDMDKSDEKPDKIPCVICNDEHPFELPDEIITAIRKNGLVIFAGSGISTESSKVMPISFYKDVKGELGIPKETDVPFSDLMGIYCEKRNGRRDLLKKIKERFDYVKSFPELYNMATDFHYELSTIPQIREIVTTNWDDFFEIECLATPIVTAEDFVFWDTPERKVLKIHGSINSYGSLVITSADYKKCYRRLNKGLIGAYLKTLLACKVIVFIGYSFGDEDFNKIRKLLFSEMKGLMPHAYIVTLDSTDASEYEKVNITKIFTDGAYFIRVVKKHLVEERLMLDDGSFDTIYDELEAIRCENFKLCDAFKPGKNPEVLYAASYQDGLKHSFERMLKRKRSGEYSFVPHIFHVIEGYENMLKDRRRSKKYHDVAYIEGYLNGLHYLISTDEHREEMPRYFIFGVDPPIRTFEEYSRLCKKAEQLHNTAYKRAKKIVNGKGYRGAEVFHHIPFLY